MHNSIHNAEQLNASVDDVNLLSLTNGARKGGRRASGGAHSLSGISQG